MEYGIDNLFVAPNVEFEVTDAERDLIEAALLHMQNNFDSMSETESGDVASIAVYRKNMVEELLEKFDRIHEMQD